MKLKIHVVVILISVVMASMLWAQQPEGTGGFAQSVLTVPKHSVLYSEFVKEWKYRSDGKFRYADEFKNEYHTQFATTRTVISFAGNYFGDSLTSVIAKPERSVAKAALFSAAIPGAGEFYNKSFLKGLAFLGIEVGSWVIYGVYTQRGNEKEDEFERYADAHWSAEEYWDWIDQQGGCGGNSECQKKYEKENFSHFLPDAKNQTYYENVGKYNQFNIGWDDTQSGGHHARDSEHREIYTRMRRDANDQFKTATLGATVVLFNHILSAIDAGLTTYRFNRSHAKASMGMEMRRHDREMVPALTVKMNW